MATAFSNAVLNAAVLLGVFVFGVSEAQSSEVDAPIFSKDTISYGMKSIRPRPEYGQLLLALDGDAQGHIRDQFDFGEGGIQVVFFINKEEGFVDGKFTFSADAVASPANNKEALGRYTLSMELLDSGLIKVESRFQARSPSKLKSRYLVIELPAYLAMEGFSAQGDEQVPFDSEKVTEWSGTQLQELSITCFPAADQKSFTIIPENTSLVRVKDSLMQFYADAEGVISFCIDIRSGKAADGNAELSPNGIDFPTIDRLHLPDYGWGKNLVMNPSFETGYRYWTYRPFADGGSPLSDPAIYEIDESGGRLGTKALKIRATRSMLLLGTIGLPFVPGEKYTLSVWARGSRDEGLSLQVDSRTGMAAMPPTKLFELNSDWTRYSMTFVPKDKFASYYFRAAVTGASGEEGFVWIDDVQIEKGELTEFSAPPVMAQLESAARGNFLEFGEPPHFRLNLQSKPGTRGTLSVSVEDFFFRSIFQNEFPFETDDAGRASITLEGLDAVVVDQKLRGVFAVTTTFKIEGEDRDFRDYFRFSIMNFLENKQKNKNLFGLTYAYSLQAGGREMERFVARERALGFGSYSYDFLGFARDIDLERDRERAELMERYGFEPMGRPVLMLHEGLNGEISENNGALKMQNVRDMTEPSAEQLAEFERICAAKSSQRPWNTIWWFTGESNPGIATLESIPDTFAKFLIATNKGIKKGNPNAKVLIEGGPWTMDPTLGTKWVERYLNDVKRIDPTVKFDGAACHFYGNFPENPDLDHNTSEFLKMLDRNGYEDWPLYLNEGGNYLPMNIPQDGFSPYVAHSGNSWLIGPLSYDIGQAERISSAFSARNWLVALKYQDRVKCMTDFIVWNRYLDVDFAPRAFDKVPNTLGRILGNASFYRDVRFAPYSRCYIFKDDPTGCPIAVVWGHKEAVDRWKESAPLAQFDFGDMDLTFVDLMENEVTFPKDSEGRTLIPMSPFPVFIKAKPGTGEALFAAISQGTLDEASAGVGDGTIGVAAYPNCQGGAVIDLRNTLGRPVKGEAQMTLNGVASKVSLEFPALGTQEGFLDLSEKNPGLGKLRDFDFRFEFAGMNSVKISNPYMLIKDNGGEGIQIDGANGDWAEIPENDVGEGVSVKISVANGNLFIFVSGKDRAVLGTEDLAGVGLFIDPFEKIQSWADPKEVREDLAVFEIRKTGEGQGAFCHYVQGTQGGSGSGYLIYEDVQKHIKVASGTTSDGAFLECMIPEAVLSPLKIEPTSRFGINISVPMKDGSIRSLAPLVGFKSPVEAGKITMVMGLVCE